MKIYDMIIIGAGPGGFTAALYAVRAGLSTLLIEKALPGGQMTLTGRIDNYPGFEEGIEGLELSERMKKSAEHFGAETIFGEVKEIDLSKSIKKVLTYEGEYFSKTVVIASGAYPRKLEIENEDAFLGRGVHYCAHCDGRFYKGKTVAVVGGGNSAVSDALYLSRLAKKVYLIHRRDSLRSTKVYDEAVEKSENIEVLFDTVLTELSGEKKLSEIKIQNVKTKKEESLFLDGVFVSIGRIPDSKLFEGKIDMNEQGYILAGEDTKTSVEGVFAVGDVRVKALRQIITAAADGAVSAHFAEEYLNSIKE